MLVMHPISPPVYTALHYTPYYTPHYTPHYTPYIPEMSIVIREKALPFRLQTILF